jgi:hypothetical protein
MTYLPKKNKRPSTLSRALMTCIVWGLVNQTVSSQPAIRLSDVTGVTGIPFTHSDGGEGKHRYIVESVASGLATFDCNNDGLIDILFLNGAPLPGSDRKASEAGNVLYRNDGQWKFTDITSDSGLSDLAYHLGVCIGDYDNDGFPDIFLSNFGPDILYRNNGDGTFTDVTQKAGVANGDQVGAGASFLDIDQDGDLDLFVANYCDFTLEKHKERHINGHPAYTGPAIYGLTADTLFQNNGDGTFTDISEVSGITSKKGTGMGIVCADYDNDGDTDIIVGNDALANFVWQNDGKGSFKEVGLLTGLAYDRNGIGLGTMGVDCADLDNDGLPDFYMTSYEQQWTTHYHNDGDGFFTDITHISSAGEGTYHEVTWGLGMPDLNHDGFRDVFIACGHLQDNIHLWNDSKTFEAQNRVIMNLGNGKFRDVTLEAGSGLNPKFSSRGAAFDDLDNDGDIDVVVLNTRQKPTLLRNDLSTNQHWVQINLKGTRSNKFGIGAKVKVHAGDQTFVDEVHSGRGYQSHYGTRLHFGLGSHQKINQIEVHWPGGKTETFQNIPSGQIIELTEGSGG